ncbi:MAG: hypothetical protein J07HN4v3_02407 [Halonotius sp. J07HN4]|nr:MAG: hypothetical protein J07HN4v3_02407 [Halonotius sp. J07HN4]
MIETGALSASVDSAALIAAVLLEAVILYGVYGVVENALGQRVVTRLRNT